MTVPKASVLADIDAALRFQVPQIEDNQAHLIEKGTRLDACLRRYAPRSSAYDVQAEAHRAELRKNGWELTAIDGLTGVLRALRADVERDQLRTIEGLVAAEIFSDLLGQAEALLAEHYRLPAAVLAGATLEEHIRKLCTRYNVGLTNANGDQLKAAVLNSELRKSGLYNEAQRAQVEAWQKVRNDAAHALPGFAQQTDADIIRMITGIRDFIVKYPC